MNLSPEDSAEYDSRWRELYEQKKVAEAKRDGKELLSVRRKLSALGTEFKAKELPEPPAEENELLTALENLLERYVSLVKCGDCGNWDAEQEDEVMFARAAIERAKS